MKCLVAIMQTQLDRYLVEILDHYLDITARHNPIGGWLPGQYDRNGFWDHFLENRKDILPEDYIEVGFTTIPFLSARTSTWRAIGILQHPSRWIFEAMDKKYHVTSGDCGRSIPQSAADYARLWVHLTKKILEYSDHIHRFEDLSGDPTPFLKHFDRHIEIDHQPSSPLTYPRIGNDIWEIVSLVAHDLGYARDGLGKFEAPEAKKIIVKNSYSAPGMLPSDVHRQELVIARYNEDINWLSEVEMPVIVYNKGGEQDYFHPRWWPLPNWGREAATYLYHIVHRYDTLAEMTYFCQGDPFMHSPNFLDRIRHDYEKATCLTCSYSTGWPPEDVRALDTIEMVHGHEIRWGDAFNMIEQPSDWHPWFNEKAWDHVFCTPLPDDVRFCYAAQWAVPRHCITRRPKKFWAWMLEECKKASQKPIRSEPPMTAWAFESLWKYLFDDPDVYTHRQPPTVRPKAMFENHDHYLSPKGSICQLECKGRCEVKPWDHQLTVVIPHLGSIEMLEKVVELWRLQTVVPYILIVDTGSERYDREKLEIMRREGVEIHYLRGHGFEKAFEIIAAANDLGQSIARTEYVVYTHADCFPRRFDLAEFLLRVCSAASPVVGYQMTRRHLSEMRKWVGDISMELLPEMNTNEWEWQVGHTLMITHAPTINRNRVRWSWRCGLDTGVRPGCFLDTEVFFNYELRRTGITPVFLGTENNFDRKVDENIDHVRSLASRHVYSWIGPHEWAEKAEKWMKEALEEAQQRLDRWKSLTGRQ